MSGEEEEVDESITGAVRRDLLELVHDLGVYLTRTGGGTLAHNHGVAADYLVKALDVQGEDTVTARMLRDVRAFADAVG